MRDLKYLFIGNRINVLHEMIRLGLDIKIIPLPMNKTELLRDILHSQFDVLVSNGCPYILPISEIKGEEQLFINVHPSLLPLFKGKSPIMEAVKAGGPLGVTCHHMVDEVDTGEIIAQLPVKADLNDINACYREMFKAEARVFRMAYDKGFK
jgi:folate-dependent phosphoribosylglycinamide formyltransferase PurN